jgi:hypothetical protein
VRALLAVAMIAVVGLTVAVVVLAATNNSSGSVRAHGSSGSSAVSSSWRPGNTRYDGGPEEGSLLATPSSQSQNPAYNYNGGHDEGNALR